MTACGSLRRGCGVGPGEVVGGCPADGLDWVPTRTDRVPVDACDGLESSRLRPQSPTLSAMPRTLPVGTVAFTPPRIHRGLPGHRSARRLDALGGGMMAVIRAGMHACNNPGLTVSRLCFWAALCHPRGSAGWMGMLHVLTAPGRLAAPSPAHVHRAGTCGSSRKTRSAAYTPGWPRRCSCLRPHVTARRPRGGTPW